MSASASTAAAGGQTLTTTSLAATTASRSASSVSPAASSRVRSLRPATVATTAAPRACQDRPRAEPIAPGETIPIVVMPWILPEAAV